MDIEKLKEETAVNLSRNKKILLSLLIIGIFCFILFILFAPPFENSHQAVFLKIPKTPDDFSDLINVINQYTDKSYFYVMAAFCYLYLLLQSFGIPGPLILSIISGALFGKWIGLCLVVACSTIGATLCYLLSETLGKGVVIRNFPIWIEKVNRMMNENKDNLFFYLLFLRLTPLLPNWFINAASPIIGVRLSIFIGASFIGLIPANVIYVNTGMALQTMQSVGLDFYSFLFLFLLGCLALVPTLVARKYKEKDKEDN